MSSPSLGVTDSVHEPAGTEPYCDELANATPVATVGPFCTDTSTSGALSEALTIRTLAWLDGRQVVRQHLELQLLAETRHGVCGPPWTSAAAAITGGVVSAAPAGRISTL